MEISSIYRTSTGPLRFLKYTVYNKVHTAVLLFLLFVLQTAFKMATMELYIESLGYLAVYMYRGYTELMCAFAHLHSVSRRSRDVNRIIKGLRSSPKSRIDWLPWFLAAKSVCYTLAFVFIEIYYENDYLSCCAHVCIGLADICMELITGEFFVITVKYFLKLSALKVDDSYFYLGFRNFYDVLDELKCVQRVFHRQHFFIGVTIMLNLPIYCYIIVENIRDGEGITFLVMIRAVNICYLSFILFLIIIPIELIKEEAKKFHQELFEVMRRNPDLCSNDKLKLYILMKPKITFTACGFFTLGYPLVTSIIAAALTYLVILVQFTQKQT